ncbi:MAG: monovalent cation/H(+) antiporter subunit G [Pseudomonadota bacterium]
MDLLFDIISWGLFIAGSAFVCIGAVGVIRFPDFYTRLHAAGVTDTLGADLILLAMVFQAGDFITMVKLLLIFIFILLTSPVSTHAIAHAAFVTKVRPQLSHDLHYATADEEKAYQPEERV